MSRFGFGDAWPYLVQHQGGKRSSNPSRLDVAPNPSAAGPILSHPPALESLTRRLFASAQLGSNPLDPAFIERSSLLEGSPMGQIVRNPSRAGLAALSVFILLTVVLAPVGAERTASSPVLESVVVASIALGTALTFPPTIDAANGNLYVPGMNFPASNGTLTVISGATNSIIATAPVGSEPLSATVDTLNGEVYVTNYAPSCDDCAPGTWQPPPIVSVVSGSTNEGVANITVRDNPYGLAFDPRNGNVYVTDNTDLTGGNGSVSVISGSTNTVTATVPVGGFPTQVFYDGANGDLYVMDDNSTWGEVLQNELTVISGATNSPVGSIPVPGLTGNPVWLDSVNGDLYVPTGSGLLVVSSATSQVVQSVSLPFGYPVYIDAQGTLYAFQAGSPANVSLISPITDTVTSKFSVGDAVAMCYDPANGNVYTVSNDELNVTSVASHERLQTLDLGPEGWLNSAPIYDPGNGYLYVVQGGAPDQLLVINTNSTPAISPSGSSSGPSNPWIFLGAGVGIGVLATVGLTSVLRKRKKI